MAADGQPGKDAQEVDLSNYATKDQLQKLEENAEYLEELIKSAVSISYTCLFESGTVHLPLMARTSTPISMTVTVLFQVLRKAIRISAVLKMTMRFTSIRMISAGLEQYLYSA